MARGAVKMDAGRQADRQVFLRIVGGLGLSFSSVALLLLAMPPYGLWPLAILGPVPWLLAQYRVLPTRLSSLAPAVAIAGFLGLFVWGLFPQTLGTPWIVIALPLGLGFIVFFTDRADRAMHERTGYRWFVLHGTVVWVGIELIRSLIPFIGTGGFIGYAYYRSPWLIQPVSVFGIYGLNVVTMVAAHALAMAGFALWDRRVRPAAGTVQVIGRQARRWLVVGGGVAAVWVLVSLILYLVPQKATTVRVAAVQPKDPTQATLFEMSRQAAAQGARVIVWPEGSLGYDPKVSHTVELRQLAVETDAYLVLGYGLRTSLGLRNEATVLSPQGEFLGVFGKDHPITLLGETSLTRGSYPVYDTPLGVLGTIICYDMLFTDTARRTARNGAQLLAAPSNDWAELADKEVAHLVFRAAENRVAAVKADTRFDSAVIDPRGRIVAQSVDVDGGAALLIADVPLGTGGAPQTYLGDWVGWLCLAGLVFFAVPNPLLRR